MSNLRVIQFSGIPLLMAILSIATPGSADADSVVDVPLDVPTIAEALALVDEGGLIRVAEGSYEGGFTIEMSLTLQGGYPPDFGGDADPWTYPTLIVGSSGINTIAVSLGTGGSVFLDGVICTGGLAGIDATLNGDASLSLDTVTCQENSRGIRADLHETAGLMANQVSLLYNSITGTGAGLHAVVDGDAVISISGSAIEGNSATDGGAGAAVVLDGNASVSFTSGTTFLNNGYRDGVGIRESGTVLYSVSDAAALFFSTCSVEGNVPAVTGDAALGGIQSLESLVQIEETEFREGSGQGGEALSATLSGTSALRLVANSFEEALHLTGPILRIDPDEQAVAHILRNRFAGNSSAVPLVVTEQLDASFVNFDGNIVRSNTTPGPMIDFHISTLAAGAFMRAINNQVSENVSSSGSGGGHFRVEGPNLAQIGYNTFYHNTSPYGVAGIHLSASDSSPAEVSDNVSLENLAGGVPVDIVVEGSLAHAISNFVTGDGDPGFVDPLDGDFRLLADSELIDAGDPDAFQIDHDFEEEDRPYNEAADIGSDEYVGSTGLASLDRPDAVSRLLGALEPNPVRSGAMAYTLTLSHEGPVVVNLNDPSGRLVATLLHRSLPAGRHRFEWNPEEVGLNSGVYFLRISAGHRIDTKKIIIAR